MAIWAIADLHASRLDPKTGQPTKPMDIFGAQWSGHMSRIEANWREEVDDADTVIVVGDTEWALHLEEAMETLRLIDSWPGRKILIRGNHDYWWSSKMTNKVRKVLPPSISLLHNSSTQVESFNISGTKGSPVPGGFDWTEENAKLLNREEQRLMLSLAERNPDLPTIVAMHYPPFYPSFGTSPFEEILQREKVSVVGYGHLHGEAAAASGPHGSHRGTLYRLVAVDAVGFRPVLLAKEGALVARERQTETGEGRTKPMDERLPLQDLGRLAEEEMSDKRRELGDEARVRELYDVPTESARDLAKQQTEE